MDFDNTKNVFPSHLTVFCSRAKKIITSAKRDAFFSSDRIIVAVVSSSVVVNVSVATTAIADVVDVSVAATAVVAAAVVFAFAFAFDIVRVAAIVDGVVTAVIATVDGVAATVIFVDASAIIANGVGVGAAEAVVVVVVEAPSTILVRNYKSKDCTDDLRQSIKKPWKVPSNDPVVLARELQRPSA